MVMKLLPGLAPFEMTIAEAPSFAEFPLYNADIQNSTGFPVPVNMLAGCDPRRRRRHLFCTPEYNFSLPGGLKERQLTGCPACQTSRLRAGHCNRESDPLRPARSEVGGCVQYDLRRAMVFLGRFSLGEQAGKCHRQLRVQVR